MKFKNANGKESLLVIVGFVFSLLSFYYFHSSDIKQKIDFDNVELNNADILPSGLYHSPKPLTRIRGKYRVFPDIGNKVTFLNTTIESDFEKLFHHQRNRLMYISTSPVWRPPMGFFLKAAVIGVINLETGKINYRTYFNQKEKLNLNTISLVVNEDDFFDVANGLMVQGFQPGIAPLRVKWWDAQGNYQLKGKKAAKSCFFEYFDTTGQLLFSSTSWLQIHGNATRAFPQKSFRLAAQKTKKKKQFNFNFFGNENDNRRLVLRNGGNDWGRTLFSDGLMQELVKDLDVESQGFVPVALYLNGEYWGIYSLREKLDEYFLASKYKCSKNDVTLIESDEFKNGEKSELDELNLLLKHFEKSKELDAHEYQEISKKIDILNFIRYIFIEMYFANTDWPHNNCKYFKLKNHKWRWGIYDLDYGYGYTGANAYNQNMFLHIEKSNSNTAKLFKLLIKSELFRNKFALEGKKMLSNALAYKNQAMLIDKYIRMLKPEMKRHVMRWRKPRSVEKWLENVNSLKVFASKRNKVVLLNINQNLRD
jgi:hypothetical protein